MGNRTRGCANSWPAAHIDLVALYDGGGGHCAEPWQPEHHFADAKGRARVVGIRLNVRLVIDAVGKHNRQEYKSAHSLLLKHTLAAGMVQGR